MIRKAEITPVDDNPRKKASLEEGLGERVGAGGCTRSSHSVTRGRHRGYQARSEELLRSSRRNVWNTLTNLVHVSKNSPPSGPRGVMPGKRFYWLTILRFSAQSTPMYRRTGPW